MSSVLITVTGPDRPGVTGVLFSALAAHRVEVLDIDQAVIRGQLTLGVLVGIQDDPESLQEDVEHAMASVRMTVRVGIDQPGDDRRRFPTHAVVVLGGSAADQPPKGTVPGPEPSVSGIFRCALASASASGFQPRAGCASLRMRSTMYGWCNSNAGRSDRIRGKDRKLCRGGGELVAHSSEFP